MIVKPMSLTRSGMALPSARSTMQRRRTRVRARRGTEVTFDTEQGEGRNRPVHGSRRASEGAHRVRSHLESLVHRAAPESAITRNLAICPPARLEVHPAVRASPVAGSKQIEPGAQRRRQPRWASCRSRPPTAAGTGQACCCHGCTEGPSTPHSKGTSGVPA